jgi:hypothetical protein
MMEIVSYIFSPVPGAAFNYSTHLFIYSILLVAAAIALKILIRVKKKNKALRKTWRTAPGQFLWTGLIIALLTASRESGIPYLSMRFLLFIALGLSVYYIFINIYKYFTKYPEMKEVTKPKVKKREKKKYTTKK